MKEIQPCADLKHRLYLSIWWFR